MLINTRSVRRLLKNMPDMNIKYSVAKVVSNGLCTSCGICAGACHKGSISFLYGRERNVPVVDSNTCVNCGICYEVCPGKGLLLNKMSEKLFSYEAKIKKDVCAGYYLQTYIGHSLDEDIRYHCATGGMVTQFLTWLLKKGEIDGAVVVRYRKDNPFEPEPFIAISPEEIWESRSSKYILLSMDKIAREIANGRYKNLVVVGLPCMIQGWRQLAQKNKKVREAIKGFFAIYCSVNKTKLSMEYYPWRYKVEKSDVERFAFRDDGCLGYMKFTGKDEKVLKKIPYLNFWFGTHSFFTNFRCSLCIDQLGELADLSFGDIHIEPYSQDFIGTNSIIARTPEWRNLLEQCCMEGFVMLEDVPISTLIRSQLYTRDFKKGPGVKANFLLRKIIGRKNPHYDYEYAGSVGLKVLFVEFCKVLMRCVGRHKSLWLLIKMIDKNGE